MTEPFQVMGYMMDIARRIERPEVVRRAAAGMGGCGYNLFALYVENAYVYPRHPTLARKHAYSPEFMAELQRLCAREGMELMPVIPSLGHAGWITAKAGYRDYDEGRGTDQLHGVVSPSFPETYDLLKELYEDWCEHVPGKYLHVGLDESPGMGQYHLRTRGPEGLDFARMFAVHCNRLNGILRQLGRRMVMWGDMLYYLPGAIELLDKDIIVADWYYYHFPKMPRVETYNFEDLDSSGLLRKAGLDVWGAPAVWPNYPFPDVRDRWANLSDWMRYGRGVGMSGILNCDWEDHYGFYSNMDLLFRAFGRGVKRGNEADIRPDFKDALEQTAGAAVPDRLVDDLLHLGEFHLTAQGDRVMHVRPLESLANAAREAECRRNYERLAGMLSDLPEVISRAGSADGQDDLRALGLSHQLLLVTWKLGAVLPGCYRRLCEGDAHKREVSETLAGLAQMVETFAEAYREHWNKVRFEDDLIPILKWADEAGRTLRAWADAARTGSAAGHPLVLRPRLELVLKSLYPALPVMTSVVLWPDGEEQKVSDILIRFESAFAQPERALVQNSAHPLNCRELPSQIHCSVRHYGQIGIEKVSVAWCGREYPYRPVRTAGEYAKKENGVVWLGPRKATPNMPMMRDKADEAWFELEPARNK